MFNIYEFEKRVKSEEEQVNNSIKEDIISANLRSMHSVSHSL